MAWARIKARCALVIGLCALPLLVAAETLLLPLRLHLMQGLEVQHMGRTLDVWVTEADLRGPVMAEVQRIWKTAGIQWQIEGVVVDEPALPVEGLRQRLEFVARTGRDDEGKSDPRRIPALLALLDPTHRSELAYNVYLLPFLGNASQGNTSRRKNVVLVGCWTNKPSKGERPPVRVKLVEPEPLEDGSLARTIAHELGHMLGLKHPSKSTQPEFGLLMGGRHAGYRLTPAEVEAARRSARRGEAR
jgi:hypothetical protein